MEEPCYRWAVITSTSGVYRGSTLPRGLKNKKENKKKRKEKRGVEKIKRKKKKRKEKKLSNLSASVDGWLSLLFWSGLRVVFGAPIK